jgi:16S rRNA (uracil1498-N3)-methyltransferase
MNLVLLRAADWIDDHSVLLRDRRAVHLREVLRSTVGDVIRVGLLGGASGQGVVEAIGPGEVRLQVSLGDEPLPPRHRFDLVLALPRPKMLRRILRTVAEFGVANLHLINSARVEKSYWQSPLLRPEHVEAALIAGLERSRDTVLPLVHFHRRYRPFVEDQLPDLCGDRPCWITDPGASRSLADTPAVPAVVMIGPEGGFVPFEVELAQTVVAQPVHLGSRILSVDTALPSVLAQALPG